MANSEIRVGRVSSVNYEKGMIRVTYRDKDDSVTGEFPMLTNNDEYRMPKVGQDVLVAHLSNGSSRGAIIGTLWNQKYSPYEAGETLYRKELSRKKDAAYIRYSDETGEYLIKVASMHLNGVHKTILDGPNLEIAANLSILLQTDALQVDVPEVLVTAGESDRTDIKVETDVGIAMPEHLLEAAIREAVLDAVEGIGLKAGTDIKLEAGDSLEMSAASEMHLSSGGGLLLSDDTYSTSLKEIMERLEALEG